MRALLNQSSRVNYVWAQKLFAIRCDLNAEMSPFKNSMHAKIKRDYRIKSQAFD